MSTPSGTPDTIVLTWRRLVLRSPGWAAGQLREFLDGSRRPADPIAADLEVLLAEALHRGNALADARDASREAVETAAALEPPDVSRLATALIIHADIAICAGRDRAVADADEAVTFVSRLATPDPGRYTLARALRAVAVFHHEDGEHGRHELTLLRDEAADTPLGAVLAEAATAMAEGLRARGAHRPPRQVPPPLRSGILQPHLDGPVTEELAYRVRAWPPKHAADDGTGHGAGRS